jgi:hypothetical protein
MKTLLAICMLFATTLVWAEDSATANHPKNAVKGEVKEAINVANFTYLRLNTGNGEIWAAVVQSQVKQGATVTIENAIVMKNFESKALKKTFPSIIFGTLAGAGAPDSTAMSAPPMATVANAPAAAPMAAAASPSTGASGSGLKGMSSSLIPKKMEATGDIHVKKASGENARTVSEIMSKGAELRDKTVLVRGKVVKYNAGIMGKNWIHLRDGTGSVEKETNDVLVTTTGSAKLGDIVTAKGVVHTDKDFGAGYSYKVLVEDATLQ